MNWRWMDEKLGEKEAVKYSGPGIRRTVVKLDKGFYKNTYPVGERALAALCKPKVEGKSSQKCDFTFIFIPIVFTRNLSSLE